jgi:2-hydroxy-6-oxonona-2,4-dienedioate hydrolase
MRASAVDVAADPVPEVTFDTILDGGLRINERSWIPRAASDPRPVVLVHGLVVSSGYLAPLARHLARRRPVHAPDLPGFGRSDRPDRALDTHELGLALADWLDTRGFEDATLVANSYGCQIASETALAQPDRVGRLALLAPTIDRGARRWPEQLRRWRREQATQSSALRRIMTRDYLRAGLGRALATARHAMGDRIEQRLPHHDLPVLVARGSRDPIVSAAWAREVTTLLPHAHLATLPGATHAIPHEMPLQTARVVEHFLDTHDTGE